jgi:large subunit ribosomal protein L25
MAMIQLKGTRREALGKGGARRARAAGQIPGVVYGHGEAPVAVAIDAKEFETALRGHEGSNPIVTLSVGGSRDVTALVRDVQLDPLTRGIIHLDFQHISLTEEIEVEVAVHFIGTPLGVKDAGGILEHIARSLKVRCLPTAIPASIDVDVTALNVGQNLHVRDIQAQGFQIVTDADVTVAAVVAPAVEEVAAPAPTEEAPAEPEVVAAKGKKEAEGATAEAGKEKEKEPGREKEPKKEKK